MRRSRADSEASHSKLSRRAVLLGSAQLLFMGGLAARMNYLQVDQADQFLNLSARLKGAAVHEAGHAQRAFVA